MSIEIYIRDGKASEVIEWARIHMNELKEITDDLGGVYDLAFSSEKSGNLLITEKIEEKNVLSVKFTGTQWDTTIDCAKEAGEKMKKYVFCDPEDGILNPYRWWRKDGASEGIVHLDDNLNETEN